jgi:hypothetical protein
VPGRVRQGLSRRSVVTLLVIVAIAIAATGLILVRLPRPVDAVGTLDECPGGWPVVVFEGEDWKAALPDNIRPYAQRQIPVADWPSGMRFDRSAGALLDRHGDLVFRKGDRVRVAGTIVETQGDPAPCFYTIGVKIDTITAP